MTDETPPLFPQRLASRSGLSIEINANGSLRRFDCGNVSIGLFLGNEVEGGPANLYLRRHGQTLEWTALLGAASPTRFRSPAADGRLVGTGSWLGIRYTLTLVLAQETNAWFWHLRLENTTSDEHHLDLTYGQDVALASYGGVRLNEFYVSQYVDHTPLTHPERGVVLASRQNQAVDGRNPWLAIGSLRKGDSFATDALQLHGLATRAGDAPAAIVGELPGKRLQHEHSMAVVRDTLLDLGPKGVANAGFFGLFVADHREATSAADLAQVQAVLALAEARPPKAADGAQAASGSRGTSNSQPAANGQGERSGVAAKQFERSDPSTLFSSPRLLQCVDLDDAALQAHFGPDRRHEERDGHGALLSFFHGDGHHVALRSKELTVLRPHGHILRSGVHVTPDESALTSTVWMNGVFHSMVTQGHVSINRFLSTVHTYLTLFRSHGQRVFMELDGQWHLLDMPSAFEMSPRSCRWLYRHEAGEVHVRAGVKESPHELTLEIEVKSGAPARFLISHHVSLNGDDGSVPGAARWRRDGDTLTLTAAPGGDLAPRFPNGTFSIAPAHGTQFQQVGGDEMMFTDGKSRQQPFLCVITTAATSSGLSIRGGLIAEDAQNPLRVTSAEQLAPALRLLSAATTEQSKRLQGLVDIVPWYAQNAFVHYLSPRGLEQFSGGGWGTRDVCQGPVELLLALGRTEPVRDLLLRVMLQQNPDGDWPQWFMFFERERNIRPGDSHGDIVFWPLVVLAQYLLATHDAAVLDERVRFFDGRSPHEGELATVWQHAERALALIRRRVIPGTALAAYGHGDWNDSLQPADPMMRERMCSAWTVTLHFQMLNQLAEGLHAIGRISEATTLENEAKTVLKDFQRLLLVNDVLAGYALFEHDGRVRYLLHPTDDATGAQYSSLAMIHAILEDLLTPEQARAHLRLIDEHLSGPDGVRLFDRPLPYHGGPQKFFQRAESATYFGREIGLMYTHAHLRYAQALAHVGEAEAFFRALCQANPIAIRSLIPSATLRQANCYYSSSDATFADRYQASEEYGRVNDGTIPLEGGWRVYSSGAGIAVGLIVRRLFGVSVEADTLSIDPVMPAALDGLRIEISLLGHPVEIQYRVGKSGHGVHAVALNDERLSLDFAPNPHRRGAARISRVACAERLKRGRNVLRIEVGG
jgi:cellobiose phosphorylase